MTDGDTNGDPVLVEPTKVIDDYLTLGTVAADGMQPSFVLIAGPVAAGKTQHRIAEYSTAHVVLDAAALFLSLAPGQVLDFPGLLEERLETVGLALAGRAIEDRRNIVTEITGMDADAMSQLVDAMTSVGYRTVVKYINCDVDVALQRNRSRGENDISAYYAEPFNLRWLTNAALSLAAGAGGACSGCSVGGGDHRLYDSAGS